MKDRNVTLVFEGIGNNFDIDKALKKVNVKSIFEKKICIVSEFIEKLNLETKEMLQLREWLNEYAFDCCFYEYYKKIYQYNIEATLPYSMGLITNMACVNSINFYDGLKLIEKSYNYSKNEKKKEMMMLVVIGMNKKIVDKIIINNEFQNEIKEAAEISDMYILLSGMKKEIIKLSTILKSKGALKIVEIDVPVAFHTDYARDGIEKFEEVLKTIKIRDSEVPICSVYSNKYIYKAEDLKNELLINIYTKMNFRNSVEKLINDGKKTFFEIGPTKSMTNMCKSIDYNICFLKK